MRQILLYIFLLFVCSVSAEQFKITGKVVDTNNEPMIGGTVMIKGTDRGTTTDIDGNFGIEVETGAILKFSYVGYISKEIEVLNDSSLVIELEEIPLEEMTPEDIEKLRIVCIQGRQGTPAWMKDGIYRSLRESDSLRRTQRERDSLKTNPKNQHSVINH